jgi:hypothetical protein
MTDGSHPGPEGGDLPRDGEPDVRSIARAGFVYGYATVDLYRILHDYALDPSSAEYKAPLNAFGHSRRLADPDDHAIVAMNVDTPYSYAWLDLRVEPVVLTLPSFDQGRYVSAELFDLYGYILGYVSPRTNGDWGGRFLVCAPGWDGDIPTWADGVFGSPTLLALVLLRTQLFDPADMPNVAAIQDGCSVQGLSAALGASPPTPASPLVTIDPVDVRAAPGLDFFRVLTWMLRFMPILDEDDALRASLAGIGVGPGLAFDADADAIVAGMHDGMADILASARGVRSSAEIFGSREHFGGDHLRRATGAFLGILGNDAAEYLGVGYSGDAQGQPFDGQHRYTIRFAPGDLPPVDAFWSIPLYTDRKLLYANRVQRYVINSAYLPHLVRDADGGCTIRIQHEWPGRDAEANWLPCPEGPFGLTFRTYLPQPPIRNGEWTAPPVGRVDE